MYKAWLLKFVFGGGFCETSRQPLIKWVYTSLDWGKVYASHQMILSKNGKLNPMKFLLWSCAFGTEMSLQLNCGASSSKRPFCLLEFSKYSDKGKEGHDVANFGL